MAKFTKKEIEQIMKFTPSELTGKSTLDIKGLEWIGSYKAPSWNWSRQVGCFIYKNKVQIAVFQFGYIVATK